MTQSRCRHCGGKFVGGSSRCSLCGEFGEPGDFQSIGRAIRAPKIGDVRWRPSRRAKVWIGVGLIFCALWYGSSLQPKPATVENVPEICRNPNRTVFTDSEVNEYAEKCLNHPS